MRSEMIPVDSARPAVESISDGPAFELKRIAESVEAFMLCPSFNGFFQVTAKTEAHR